MKKMFMVGVMMLFMCSGLVNTTGALAFPGPDKDPVITDKIPIGDEIIQTKNPLRDGAFAFAKGIRGIYNIKIDDTSTARERTTNYIKGIINYFLSLIGLIALIYMLYHGFLALTAGGNEEQFRTALQGTKYAAIALVGIGLSRFFLSLVFWLMWMVTS